jgi:DMSO/TMAO reductase YedYZ molybdopterin-dependent catalytic subunit
VATGAHDSGPTTGPITFDELQLATRNRGMPLEALHYDLTPTGLHYLLVHFDIPVIDESSWQLAITGAVSKNLSLTLDDIRERPKQTRAVTMECAGNGRARLSPRPVSQPWLHEAIGTAEWGGTPLSGILSEAGLRPDAVEVVFAGADRGIQGDVEQSYERSLSIDDATREEVLLAYEMNGEPLQPQHGFPLRLLVPGWYGMTSVKWLTTITAVTEPFEGFQQTVAYRYQRDENDPGEPVSRIRVRALMIPPGIPHFFNRGRVVDRGRVVLRGRAWCGVAPLDHVEVGIDGEWHKAELDAPVDEFAWRGWRFEWDASPGEHELSCRGTDAAGNSQPEDQAWSFQGMGNNSVQKIAVTVR